MITLLVAPEEIDAPEIEVAGEAYRHLFRARRTEVGETIRVVDGRSRARAGTVSRIERKAAWIALGAAVPTNEPALRLTLLVPTLRPERAAWLVEKATELGVAALRFLHTERAPRTFGPGTLERLRRVSASALEQCHGATLPDVDGPHEWADLERLAKGATARWVLDPSGATGFSPPADSGEAALLVGPEGGLTAPELAAAIGLGFSAVSLGMRILRIETAAVAGAAAVLLR